MTKADIDNIKDERKLIVTSSEKPSSSRTEVIFKDESENNVNEILYVVTSICAAIGVIVTVLLGLLKKFNNTMRDLHHSINNSNSTNQSNTTNRSNAATDCQSTQTESRLEISPIATAPKRPPPIIPQPSSASTPQNQNLTQYTPHSSVKYVHRPHYSLGNETMDLTNVINSEIEVACERNETIIEVPENNQECIEIPLKDRLRSQTKPKELL